MANPFVADSGDPTADLPGAETFGKIRDQWNTFLDQPGGRAALLQAGLTLMQPPSFGDNAASMIGRAIGSGGEAAGRQEAMDIKQTEAESKAAAREATANLAGERAKYAGAASQLGSEREANRLTIAKMGEEGKRTRAEIEVLNKLHKAYLEERDTIKEGNAKITRTAPPDPIPTFDEWKAGSPLAQEILRRAGSGGVGGATPAAPAAPAAVPEAPPAAERKPNTKYNTPRGVMTWTGTGWIP